MESWLCANGFVEHPKHGQLAKRLGLADRDKAVMVVLRLFCWVARVRERGELGDLHEADIADACRWRGKPAKLVEALVDVGWLDLDQNGGLVVHDWIDRHIAFLSRREANRAAKRRERARRAAGQLFGQHDSQHDVSADGGTQWNGMEWNRNHPPYPPPAGGGNRSPRSRDLTPDEARAEIESIRARHYPGPIPERDLARIRQLGALISTPTEV